MDHIKSKKAWITEYTKQGIPSSFRKEPTELLQNLSFGLKKGISEELQQLI